MNRFQRIALAAFICLEVLIFVGAMVRATGSGLGCPDWPFCYGCWVPPTSADQIDFTKLDIDKFKAKAAQHGRDPDSITTASLKAEFDPVAVWVEYFNRLSSIPVSLSVVALVILSCGRIQGPRIRVRTAVWAAVFCLGMNAWLGARVVLSGLKPGAITAHMALAILMLCVLIYAAWASTDRPWRMSLASARPRQIACMLFALVVGEGIMGSQVRELTDHLAALHSGHPRGEWVHELEQSWVYLVHRSFSWLVLGFGLWFVRSMKKAAGAVGRLEKAILSLIFAQMLLGLVLSQIGIIRVAQILHIGLSSLLVSALFLMLLGTSRKPAASQGAEPYLAR
ncbi:MAG: Cytochrome c oxidase assembly protein subunit 15 [Verrucomicrobiaceae bacterium]|nr:Cytochrome c oxidase assembly protein subunit 15 [Verrucomicrobiaceae bacterium]